MLAQERIKRISEHIIDHYKTKIYPAGHKGMVVCHNRAAAIAYKKAFDELKELGVHSFNSRVVMSFSYKKDPQKYFDLATAEEDLKQAKEDFKLPFGDESQLTKGGKKQFNNDALIIVSDMLLTGYDAPIASVMYLDKLLKEHNLLQGIARVNRTKVGKNAGLIVDYCGVTEHLVEALKIFAGDINPSDIMVNIKEEIELLKRRHSQLVAFFRELKSDRIKQRQEYIDEAVHYLEPKDLRDEFLTLLKKFNDSMSIVLPDPKALDYQEDFYLFNEIKLVVFNTFSPSIAITKEDNRKIQKLIDEHLRATGIENLLEHPVSIIDAKKFKEEINKTFSGKSKELKIKNRIRHTIRVEIDKNPEFYKPLSERLEQLIKEREEERINQLDFLKALEEIQETIVNKSKEAKDQGFNSDREFAVFKSIEKKIDGDAKIITGVIFKAIEDKLNLDNWHSKDEVLKNIRVNIKEIIRGKVPKDELQSITVSIVNVLKSN